VGVARDDLGPDLVELALAPEEAGAGVADLEQLDRS
jgi:hypothetical protein